MKCNLKKPESCFQCPYQDCLDGGAKIDNRETEFLKASELTNLSHKQKIIRNSCVGGKRGKVYGMVK